jgi:hypothetical protein
LEVGAIGLLPHVRLLIRFFITCFFGFDGQN